MKCWRDFRLGNINKAHKKTQVIAKAEQFERMETYDASGYGVNEDSVDIYEGLDLGNGSNTETSPAVSLGLKDSMDLYEDIVAEEQQHRESSYSELKSRFQAAQQQINELHKMLEQMEKQNTRLSTENNCLKKNISSLLRTAKQEVVRKDAEIQRLSQGTQRFHHHLTWTKSIRNPSSAGRPSTTCSSARTLSPLHPPPPNSQSKEEPPLADAPQPSTKETCHFNNSIKPLRHNHSKREHVEQVGDIQTEPDRHEPRDREEKCQYHRRLGNCLHHSKDSDHKQAHKDTGQGHGSRSHKNRKYQNVERHSRSDGTQSSSQERLYTAASSEHKKQGDKVQRTDKATSVSLEHNTVPDYQSGGSCSSEYGKISKGHRYDKQSNSKDKKSSSPDPPAKRCGDGTKERDRNRQKCYHKSVDRRREGEIRRRHHRRSSQEESSREREKQRAKQSGKVDVCKEGRWEKKSKDVKRSCENPNPDANISVDGNNSNRKLCFMEVLNLTLSPIKKHLLPRDGTPEELPKVDYVEDRSAQKDSQPNIDDMYIIDEVDNSEVAEQSTEDLKAQSTGKTSNRFVVEDLKEHARNVTASPGKTSSSSPQNHSQDTAEDERTVLHTTQSPKSCSLKAVHDSKLCEEQSLLVSNGQITEHGQLEVTESSQPSNPSPHRLEQHKSTEVQTIQSEHVADLSADVIEAADVHSDESPVPQSVIQDVVNEAAASAQSKGANDTEDMSETSRIEDQQWHQAVSPSMSQQGLCLPSSTSVTQGNNNHGREECSKDLDSVSSTICLDSLSPEGLSLTEAIDIMTQTNVGSCDGKTVTSQPNSSVGCIGVSKVSSTTEEDTSPEKYSTPTVTPTKICSQDYNTEPSSSVSLPHDEDSMMHTLSNLKRIPEAISPLRSPVQIAKRSGLHLQSRLGHVKSLQKELSTTAAETTSKKLDVNKENKYPDAQNVVNTVPEQTSCHFDTELEEGEILSESDEATSSSPVPATKRAKLTEPVRNKPSLTSFLGKNPEECQVAPKESLDSAAVSTQSPRSRFKTICPTASKASFSTVEEIMETFKLVRREMRKKYMKLHKTFPKKSFYGVMDNFQKSFLEFVDGAQFGQICDEAEKLKSKLRKLIASVFNKVLNNGIVKRIFEQQAVNLKQKLWDFVDVQVDYLFMDIQTTLKSLCQPVMSPTEDKRSRGERVESQQAPLKKPLCKQNKAHSPISSLNRTKSRALVPYRTGLGSRGKDIRMSRSEKDGTSHVHPPEHVNTQAAVDFLSCNNLPLSPEKNKMSPLVISQNGSMLDKTDFQLLTEQQASNLTFNLVRDSQMGEIFKCLLQGSDLLESTGVSGDTAWSIDTPRKDGERFLGFTTPSKFHSPSKSDTSSRLIATWCSISPRKRSSPCAKDQIPLNPALFDESCLLEVPSENRALLQGSLTAEKSYSILAEDLAVSLTIPSPLKSDNHLSFLQPAGIGLRVASTPDSVISAHIGEDALLDGEDATEQDIHLSLDNSSCSSKDSTTSETPVSDLVFKPDVPMQALVIEKSNDHFIVKIQQVNTTAETTLVAEESLSQALIEQDQQHKDDDAAGQECQNDTIPCTDLPSENKFCLTESPGICQPNTRSDAPEQRVTLQNNPSNQRQDISTQSGKTLPKTAPLDDSLNTSFPSPHSVTGTDECRTQLGVEITPPKAIPFKSQKQIGSSKGTAFSSRVLSTPLSPNTNQESPASQTLFYDSSRDETNVSESEKSLTIDTSSSSEKPLRGCEQLRKRKRRQEKLKTKRSKKEKSLQEASPSNKPSPVAVSPSSLSAKNIVRKKGEVVMAWTRDEDRAILMYLKTKGSSRETFSALSEKLNKPSSQIAERFYQLMKLFKKQEKMDT